MGFETVLAAVDLAYDEVDDFIFVVGKKSLTGLIDQIVGMTIVGISNGSIKICPAL